MIEQTWNKVKTFKKLYITVYVVLFQNEFVVRLIAASVLQIWPIFYMSYFAYKLLNRAKNRSTYMLSGYFITSSLAYFLATISIFLSNTPFAYIIYVISIYVFVFSFCFLINFSWLLTRLDEKSCRTIFFLRIIFFAILSLYVLLFAIPFSGITLNASTGWVPIYSWFFLGINLTYFLLFLILPQIYLSFKILKEYKGIYLKKRLNRFIISVILMLYLAVCLFLYHAWTENMIFKTFHTIQGLIFGISAAYLVYKGFGKELD